MLIKQFYNLVDNEITSLLTTYCEDDNIKKHNENRVEQRKSYAFLIWFLEFYGQKSLYKNYITDGNGDYSCDIIFSNTDSQNQTIFYVVQSKWVKLAENKELDSIDSKEFGKTLTDFSTILSGSKKNTENEKFNKKYQDLIEHLEKNGKVKFIFFTLAAFNPSIDEAIVSFNKNYSPHISLEVIDINRIRRDYIDFKFKHLQSNNPLEYNYSPEEDIITLQIERNNTSNKKEFLEYEGIEKAYIFLLKPKTIFDLFEKYKFNLFFKNVRNPIHESNYNKKIVETLNKKPSSFWYFNNGITAITEIMPEVGIHAKEVKIHGLQIINGAQTVYSIYQAYKDASAKDRKKMDADARISLRLIKSSNEDFNLEITRFTNSQNPLYDRDFVSNHEIQQRLQNESFNTNVWYEKRRDEFRIKEYKDLEILIVPNEEMLPAYVAFHLQSPLNAATKQEYFFVSHKEHLDGLYEKIFDENTTKYEDILASYYMWQELKSILKVDDTMIMPEAALTVLMPTLALSNVVLTLYFKLKYSNFNKDINLSRYIRKTFESYEEDAMNLFIKVIRFSLNKIMSKINVEDEEKSLNNYRKLVNSLVFYQTIKDEIEEHGLTMEDIENTPSETLWVV